MCIKVVYQQNWTVCDFVFIWQFSIIKEEDQTRLSEIWLEDKTWLESRWVIVIVNNIANYLLVIDV